MAKMAETSGALFSRRKSARDVKFSAMCSPMMIYDAGGHRIDGGLDQTLGQLSLDRTHSSQLAPQSIVTTV